MAVQIQAKEVDMDQLISRILENATALEVYRRTACRRSAGSLEACDDHVLLGIILALETICAYSIGRPLGSPRCSSSVVNLTALGCREDQHNVLEQSAQILYSQDLKIRVQSATKEWVVIRSSL